MEQIVFTEEVLRKRLLIGEGEERSSDDLDYNRTAVWRAVFARDCGRIQAQHGSLRPSENKWRGALVCLIVMRRMRVLDNGFRYLVRVDLIGAL
jgi:hypothetical protein